jgi:hypothetical protein
MELTDAYKSLNEALVHAGVHTRTRVRIHYIDSERIETEGSRLLEGKDAILVPGGFGERGVEGKIDSVRFAREHGVPYLGICLGMQVAVIECARHLANLDEAHSTEFRRDTRYPVIGLVTEWTSSDGTVERRKEGSDLGGTMRLGGQRCVLPASMGRTRSPSDTATGTSSTTNTARSWAARAWCSPEHLPTVISWKWSNCQTTPGFSPASFTPNSPPRRVTDTLFSPASLRRPGLTPRDA